MHYSSIKYHLRPYRILERRKTTINHAFAAAIAPYDLYEEARIRRAVEILGQDPDQDLRCVYCNEEAQTWDHVFGTVKQSRFSGHGHRLGNLVPSCKKCNSSKGNKNWKDFLEQLGDSEKLPSEIVQNRESTIHKYLTTHSYLDVEPHNSPDYDRLLEIRSEVLDLLKQADELAERIRGSAS
jgi:hypothetical protein